VPKKEEGRWRRGCKPGGNRSQKRKSMLRNVADSESQTKGKSTDMVDREKQRKKKDKEI